MQSTGAEWSGLEVPGGGGLCFNGAMIKMGLATYLLLAYTGIEDGTS
jgi:hypothetical protein